MLHRYSQLVVSLVILTLLSVILVELPGTNSSIVKFVGMCLSGVAIALVFTFASLLIYQLPKGGTLGRTALVGVHFLLSAILIYISYRLGDNSTIVGVTISPDREITQVLISGLYLSSTLGLTGTLVDLSLREPSIKLFALFSAIVGHIMTIAIYSSLSILPVIVCSLITRDVLSLYLYKHTLIQENREPIVVSLTAICVSIIIFGWTSFLALA